MVLRRSFLAATAGVGSGISGCFGRSTRVQWSFETDSNAAAVYAGPAVEKGSVYFGDWNGQVYSLRSDTGELDWNRTVEGPINMTPLVHNDTLYIGTLEHDHTLYAFDTDTGEQRWTYTTTDDIAATPVVANTTVYLGSIGIHALDRHSGDRQWQYGTGGVPSSLLVSEQIVYFADLNSGNDTYDLVAVDATTGTPEWRHQFAVDHPGLIPHVAGVDRSSGTLYFGLDTLYMVDAATGAVRDSLDLPARIRSSSATPSSQMRSRGDAEQAHVVVGETTIYIGWAGHLLAVDRADRSTQWVSTPDAIGEMKPPVVHGDSLYVSGNNVYAFDARTGEREWRYGEQQRAYTAPTYSDGTLYVGSPRGAVYALNAEK